MLRLYLLAAALPAVAPAAIDLLPSAIAHTFTGHGGLSAGASSRLLFDYPAAQQSDILDMLFLPNHGLSLHIIKVEVGGDAQSTDGTEASHMHSRGDLSCTRGYELPLMKAARARNPNILTYGLSWGAPAWINNGSYFGPEMVEYQTQWVKCMAQEGVSIDYMGVWNERYWGGVDYVKSLRAGLDAAGFAATKIIIPDGRYDPAIMAAAAKDAAFNASFDGIGLHYPCHVPAPEVAAGGKLFWASEDWWSQPDWAGAGDWGHLLTQNYARMNATSTIAWSPLWAVYDDLNDEQAGLVLANQPWSGWWQVSAPVWTGAQWCQFTQPGWRFLSAPSGGSGALPLGGYYTALVPPAGGGVGLTVILETLVGGGRCAPDLRPALPQTLTFTVPVTGGAPLPPPGATLQVWQTNASAMFVRQSDLVIAADGSFSVTIAPDSMVTVSTVAGAHKGAPASAIPPPAPFPLPYSDDFSAAAYPQQDAYARYFADQFGSFAVRSGRLVQTAAANPGKNGWSGDADPLTIIGSSAWMDYSVSVSVSVPPPPSPLTDGAAAQLLPCNASSAAQVWSWGSIAPGYVSNAPPQQPPQCLNVYGCQSRMVYWSCVTAGGTCCGAACYDGLKWRVSGGGGLESALAGGGCVTVAGPPFSPQSALTLAACGGGGAALSAGQRFSVSNATGLVELVGTGLCLATPPPPPPPPAAIPYSRLCGRLGALAAFRPGQPLDAWCLALVGSQGAWEVVAPGGGVAAAGSMAAPPGVGSEVALGLAFRGQWVSASVGGVQVANVTAAAGSSSGGGGGGAGRVALGSGFWPAQFGNFAVGL